MNILCTIGDKITETHYTNDSNEKYAMMEIKELSKANSQKLNTLDKGKNSSQITPLISNKKYLNLDILKNFPSNIDSSDAISDKNKHVLLESLKETNSKNAFIKFFL